MRSKYKSQSLCKIFDIQDNNSHKVKSSAVSVDLEETCVISVIKKLRNLWYSLVRADDEPVASKPYRYNIAWDYYITKC